MAGPARRRSGTWIDPRGHRFGAGVSALVLLTAWLTDSRWLVGLVFLSLASSAVFGLRYSVYGRVWRGLARLLRLRQAEPEHEYGPRFAQSLGSLGLALALVGFVIGVTPIGWGLTLAVVALQVLLAATGYCVGCRLYGLQWYLPALFTAWWQRGAPKEERIGLEQIKLERPR